MPRPGESPCTGSSSSKSSPSPLQRFLLELPPVKVKASSSAEAPSPGIGAKMPASAASPSASISQNVGVSVASSSATPAAIEPPIAAEANRTSGTETGTQAQGEGTNPDNPVVVGDGEDGKPQKAQISGKRVKKCTSDVWQYFTKKTVIVEANGKQFQQLWATCNFPNCKAKYRAESNKGTTGFWTHLKTAHSVVKGQQQLSVEKDQEKNLTVVKPFRYDEAISLRKFYLAIIMHEYPFSITEHEYLVDFIHSLRPTFPIKSRITVRKEIMELHLEEKEKLYAHFKTIQGRFSTTMDMWTSNQNKGYMCITVHWIDDDWHMQKRIVNFFHLEGQHTGERFSQTFAECMVKWYIDKKLCALTLDNAASNEVAVKDIIKNLQKAHAPLICEGLFFHVRCANHILNLVARDGMSVISYTVENIKKLVLTVKGSPLQWEQLMKCASECNLDTKKGISLDVSTRWNSTFLMLRDALYYKDAFFRLMNSNVSKYENITPTEEEWRKAALICHGLKKFYDLTELFSGTLYPTANLFFKGFCEIRLLLADWKNSIDITLSAMAASMIKKFEKYWKRSNIALAVAAFLDPRYKNRLVEYYLKKLYGDQYQSALDDFFVVLKKIFQFYASTAPAPPLSIVAAASDTADLFTDTGDADAELDSYLYEKSDERCTLNELDKYMSVPLKKHVGQFDILEWWKLEKSTYPILCKMARDVLAIQVSTVASESAFSAGGCVIDQYRSRLDPEIVQALVCTKDWVAASKRDSKAPRTIVVDLDAIEDVVRNLCLSDDGEEYDNSSDPDEMNDEDKL